MADMKNGSGRNFSGSDFEIRFFEDLKLGDQAQLTRVASESDVAAFAAVTGDDNPVHLDEAYAAATPFKTRIAHGMLSAGYISAVLGTRLPGPGAIYLGQTLAFKRPVKLGDTVTAQVEIVGLDPEKARATLKTECRVDGKIVADGEALVLVPRRPG